MWSRRTSATMNDWSVLEPEEFGCRSCHVGWYQPAKGEMSDYRVREVRREGKIRMVILSLVTHEHVFVTRVSHEQ